MPEFIIRVIRQVEVFQKVEERTIEAESAEHARREAAFILADEYAEQTDVQADVNTKKEEEKPKEGTKAAPF